MDRSPGPSRVTAYINLVVFAGVVLLVHSLVQGLGDLADVSITVALFAFGVVIGELFPLRIHRPGAEGEVTPSTTFAFALVLVAGYGAVPLMVVTCLFCDRATGKAPVKMAFNAAQYAITVWATAAVLASLTGVPHPGDGIPFAPADLPGTVLAGCVFFAVNSLLVAGIIALIEHQPIHRCLSDDMLFQATSAGLLLGLSPMVVLSTVFSPWLLPLFVLPLLSIVQGQRQALLKEHEAIHDALTGLPNRVLFSERVEAATRVGARDDTQAAVMIIDLDGFKEINDTLGHHEGDRLLIVIADRLRQSVREDDVVARLGGDEFGVLVAPATRDEAALVADKLQTALRTPLDFDEVELQLGGSVGIALFPDHGQAVKTLLQHADVAMYRAKREGLGVEFYDPDDSSELSRTQLAADLRRGLDAGELIPFFQPKIELATGRVIGAEALMRWQHPERGLLPPSEFIGLAEQSGLIVLATEALLERCLRARARWLADGHELTVAVNLSPRSLLDRRLPQRIAAVLDATDSPPGALELEITESMLMADPERAADLLQRIRERGVSVSLDDFGTGYSSLERLQRLPLDAVKIDRSFVMDMHADRGDAVIVETTVHLAHKLGLLVVGEGVETPEALAALTRMGCDHVQGFYVARPMPEAEFGEWLAATGLLQRAATAQRAPSPSPAPAPSA